MGNLPHTAHGSVRSGGPHRHQPATLTRSRCAGLRRRTCAGTTVTANASRCGSRAPVADCFPSSVRRFGSVLGSVMPGATTFGWCYGCHPAASTRALQVGYQWRPVWPWRSGGVQISGPPRFGGKPTPSPASLPDRRFGRGYRMTPSAGTNVLGARVQSVRTAALAVGIVDVDGVSDAERALTPAARTGNARPETFIRVAVRASSKCRYPTLAIANASSVATLPHPPRSTARRFRWTRCLRTWSPLPRGDARTDRMPRARDPMRTVRCLAARAT
jgi:hypothetical protein